jgi:hypothetical protein
MIRYRKWRQLTFSSTWLERLPDLHSAQSCSLKSCPSVETHECHSRTKMTLSFHFEFDLYFLLISV